MAASSLLLGAKPLALRLVVALAGTLGVLATYGAANELTQEDDEEGNVQHIREHDVTIEEAEEVLLDPESSRAVSRSSGLPTVFGWTSTERYLAVVYELVDDEPLTLRPITAYEVPPPAPKTKRRKR